MTLYFTLSFTPKKEMSLSEKLYYSMCIKANSYRYNYGRQANKTLKDINLPDYIPEWVYDVEIKPITTTKANAIIQSLEVNKWGEYTLGELFRFHKGKRLTKEDMSKIM